MALPIVPPDLIGAGVTGQPQEPQMPSRGTLPQSALTSLLPPQPQQDMSGLGLLSMLSAPQAAPNIGLVAAAGVLDPMAGRRGGNSYLAQHAQMTEQQQARQMQQARLMDSIMERRRRAQEQREAAADQIVDGLRDSDNPNAQALYSREMARRAKRYGLNVEPTFFAQTATLGKDEVESINGDIVAGLPVPEIMARHPKLNRMPPGWLKSQAQILSNPTMRTKLGYKSDDELKAERDERERKVAEDAIKKWRANAPEVTDEQLPHVANYVRVKTGTPLTTVDPSTPQGRAILAAARTDADRKIDAAKVREIERKTKSEAVTPTLANENAIRQQFNTLTKDSVTIIDSYRRINAAAQEPSAAGDLALIFNYMKMLDPGSVVRESEFANAQNSAGVPERIRAQYNRLLRGERLSDDTRRDFVKQARGQFAAQRRGYLQVEKEYRRIAEASGMDPARTVPDHLGELRENGPLGPAPGRVAPTSGPLTPTPASGWGPARIKR